MLSFNDRNTDSFYFRASSAEGAVGDFVSVDLSLTVDELPLNPRVQSIVLNCCYDNTALELLESPVYSDAFEAMTFLTYFFPLKEEFGQVFLNDPSAFVLIGETLPGVAEEMMLSGESIPIATVYFRIIGDVGSVVPIRFCDREVRLSGGACSMNQLTVLENPEAQIFAHSTLHQPGLVRVLPGEATQTEPVLPVLAKVYDETPTSENTEIVFELGGAIAMPGARDVALPVYVTSSHEFSGVGFHLEYPQELARVTRVEEVLNPGALLIDAEAGRVGLMLHDSRRRLGREAERVHVATIYMDIEEAASEAGSIPFRFENSSSFVNWIGIRYRDGTLPDFLPVTGEVAPTLILQPLVRVQTNPTFRGDVDLDYSLTMTDAVITLGHLFLGQEPGVCEAAADFDDSGEVNISDPIALLGHLFIEPMHPTPLRDILCEN